MKKKKVRDQIPSWEKPWEERDDDEKFQAIVKYKKKTIILCSIIFLLCCIIMALLTSDWVLLIIQLLLFCAFGLGINSVKDKHDSNISIPFIHISFTLRACLCLIGLLVSFILYFI